MPPLDAAFALAKMQEVAVMVAQHLKFDVPGTLDKLFQVHVGNAKGLLRLVARGLPGGHQVLAAAHHAHAPAAAARRRFDDQRIPDAVAFGGGGLGIEHQAVAPRHDGHSRGGHLAPRLLLFTHQPQHLGRGADKADVRGLANLREIRVFGQEAVARVNRVHVGDFRRADDMRNIQVAFRAARRPDAHGLIRKTHVQRIAVGLRIDGHCGDVQLLAGADHPQSNFTAIGDKNFAEHDLQDRDGYFFFAGVLLG